MESKKPRYRVSFMWKRYKLSDSGRKEHRAALAQLSFTFPMMLVMAVVVLSRFADYFSVSSVYGWTRVGQAILFCIVLVVIFGVIVFHAVSYRARQRMRIIESTEFDGELFF